MLHAGENQCELASFLQAVFLVTPVPGSWIPSEGFSLLEITPEPQGLSLESGGWPRVGGGGAAGQEGPAFGVF